jgi:peptidoglycan-associated lipoprotein
MSKVVDLCMVRRAGKLGVVGGCLFGLLMLGMGGCSSRLQTTVMSGTEPPPAKPQVVKVEQASAPAEDEVLAETFIGIPPMDIPVEEPVRPVIPPSVPSEIFSTPRTGDAESAPSPFSESPLAEESVAPPSPEKGTTPGQPSPQELAEAPGIPPISFEPEKPTLPMISEQDGPDGQSSPQELAEGPGIPPISFEPEKPSLPTIREQVGPGEGPLARGDSASIQESEAASSPFTEGKPIELEEDASIPEEPVQMAKVDPSDPEAVESRSGNFLRELGDVYFDYDRFSVRKEAIPVLQENAQVLTAGLSNKSIVIEGHCDERGTESYNMVLGERRAKAVKEYLIHLGVPGEKIQVVSYGKERPFCTDQNEQCWQENRRSHFVLR